MREVGVRTTRYSPPPSEYSPTFRDLTWFGLIGMFYRLQARIIRQTILQSRMLFNAWLVAVCRIFVSFGWRRKTKASAGNRKRLILMDGVAMENEHNQQKTHSTGYMVRDGMARNAI